MEERKSKLQASRQRVAQRGLSPTRFESKNLFDVAELDSKRRAALFASRLQAGLGRRWQGEAIRQAVEEDQPTGDARRAGLEGLAADDYAVPQGVRGRMTLALERTMARRRGQEQEPDYAQTADETSRMRKEVKKKAEATMRRGAIAVVDSIAVALDLSSSGISFLIDVFFYLFTLGWLNLEMFYGKYFAKGKSRYISPISWEPIPMPVDKDALLLQGFVVAADLALGLAVLAFLFLGVCVLHDFALMASSLTAAGQIGASLASGGTGGLCLGGIIASVVGL